MLYGFDEKPGWSRGATALLAAGLIMVQCACPALCQQTAATSVHTGHVSSSSSGRHPKLRKFARVAAIGALTGGIGGLILGGSLATHALVGAGVRTGVTAVHDGIKSHRQKKRHSLAEHATGGGDSTNH